MGDNCEDDTPQLIMTLDLPDDLKRVIGEISIAYGQLEFALAMCIKRTDPKIDIEDARVLAESLSARLATAGTRFAIWYKDQRREAEFERLIERATQLAKHRNGVVHALWAKNKEGEICWLRMGFYRSINLDELGTLRDDIYRVTAELNGTTRNDGIVTFDAETTAASSFKIIGPLPD